MSKKSDVGLRLRYEQHELNPRSARVYLNDIDISKGLRGFCIEGSPGMLTEVHLDITPSQIDIDATTLAVLTAIVEQGEGDES